MRDVLDSKTAVPANAPATVEQRQLVQRILGSELFSKSHRLAAFLRFIFEQYSRGQASSINEQRIGTEVFGRPPGYHVGEDSIVRSQARFLRLRLEEYFQNEGSREPFVLSIPKGSYVPSFEPRKVLAVPKLEPAAPQETVGISEMLRSRRSLRWVAGISLAVAVAVVLVLFRASRQIHVQSAEPPSVKAFWSSIFSPGRAVVLVPADSTLVLMEEISGKPIRLHAYINKDYLNDKEADTTKLWPLLIGSQYTNMADLNLVARLEQVPEAAAARPQVRYAREVTLKELKEANAVLIGGLRANPWMELFSPSVHFDVDYDNASGHNVVRNRAPGPNEQAIYIEDASGAPPDSRSYGVITYLPSLDTQGHALLVEGTSKAGTEAAAEFLSSPAFVDFLNRIGASADKVPDFELLLSTSSMDGASYHPAVVCWHLLRSSASH